MPRGDMQLYQVFDFQRGLDVKTSPLKLAVQRGQNSLVKARNAVYTSSGGASKRLDAAHATAGTVGLDNTVPYVVTGGLGAFITGAGPKFLLTGGFLPSGTRAAITGGFDYVKADGTRIVVFGTDAGMLYKMNGDGSHSQIGSGFTTGTRWYFAEYNSLLLIGNRADAPQKWDGTTLAPLGGTPPAMGGPVYVHGNRVFWFDAEAPSDLVWSALNDEEDYTTADNAGRVSINPNDGSSLVAAVPSINELVLLKGRRPYRLQGTSPETFTITNIVPTTGSVGAVSHSAALFALNDVWYLGSPGLVRLTAVQAFGDLRESFPSGPIQPYFEDGTGYTLALNNLDQAVMAYDSQRNRIYTAVDADGDGQNEVLLVYDGVTRGWSVWDGLSIASMWPVLNEATGQTDIWAGGYDGVIRILNRDVATTAIDCEVRHLSALGAPGVEKSVRHLYFYFKEQGNTIVSIDTRFDFGAKGGQVYTASLLGGSKTLGVNWVLGQDPLGAATQIVKRLDVHGTGEFMEVGVRNAEAGQPFTWLGYEALFRSRRLIRRGTAVA